MNNKKYWMMGIVGAGVLKSCLRGRVSTLDIRMNRSFERPAGIPVTPPHAILTSSGFSKT
jgi:hypothetical protein